MRLLFKIFRRDWWVVCNSKVAQQEVREMLSPHNSIHFIGNGIDTNHFKKRYDLRDEEAIITYVGRIVPQKNIELLIHALPLINQKGTMYSLHIQGAIGDQKYYQFLRNEIIQYSINHKVTFVEPSYQDVRDAYSKSSIFVLPSLYEGTPNVLLEAMSCECVCLCSSNANSDQFLSKEFTFASDNPVELAEKVTNMTQLSNTQRESIGKQNRTYVINSYSVPTMVNTLTNIIIKKVVSH